MTNVKADMKGGAEMGEVEALPFDNILNFRDVGKTINDFIGKKCVVEGRLFRCARPDDATTSDRRRLVDEYGIKTVMDLRTQTEHITQARKRASDLKVPAILQSNDALAEPLKIPGMEYCEININGKGFERSLLWKLHPWSLVKLVTFMVLGYRMKAISILGREVMQPRGLVGLGRDSIDHCGPEIAEALRALSSLSNYPVVVHCTQGKDRTGLIIALLLFLLDIPIKAISFDYCMSEQELEPERESRLVEIKQIGLSEDFASCPTDWIEKMDEHLQETYGGVGKYFTSIGFDEKEQGVLIGVLRA